MSYSTAAFHVCAGGAFLANLRLIRSNDTPFQVSTSPKSTYYVSLQPTSWKGYKIKVTELDSESGRVVSQQSHSAENEISGPESILYVGPNGAGSVIVWADKSLQTLKVNVIGSKHIQSFGVENDSGEEVGNVQVHAAGDPESQSHFAVNYESQSKSWADVYHTDPQKMTVSRAYRLPLAEGKSILAASTRGGNVYFTRITKSEISVTSSALDKALATWPTSRAISEVGQFAVSEVVDRGSTAAVRFAQIEQSGDWSLVRNGELEWTRPECLSDAVEMIWADLNGAERLAHELEVEGHQNLLSAYIHRVKRHAKALQHFPMWLRELPLKVLSSLFSADGLDISQFGFGKLAIVATTQGRVLAIDTGRHGKVVWNTQVMDTLEDKWGVKLIAAHHGIATVYVDDGSSVKLDVSSGEILERTQPTEKFSSMFLVPGSTSSAAVGINSDGIPIAQNSLDGESGFIVALSEDGKVKGWSTHNLKTPVWEFLPPKGYKLTHATARPSHDPVASIGKVLGNRSVFYKYLNPNLVLVTAVGESTATFYLLDGVSGQILHTMSHSAVDVSQPITSTISENWFAYSLWADVTHTSEAKGYQLVVSELYESPIPNDRGVLDDAGNYSSIRGSTGLPRPHAISQAYVVPEAISNMVVTQTRQGITIRQLLCTLPAANAIVGIPRPVIDPRRPVGRDPTSAEVEEGLTKYTPFLDFDSKWYMTHTREVSGIRRIESSPTLLESTTLIFAYGFDVFGTRLAPSQPFDMLGKGFSKIQLLLTVVALAVGVMMLAPMVRSLQVATLVLNHIR